VDCSSCGDRKADVGFVRFYCPNPECQHFDEAQLNKVVAEAEKAHDEAWEQLTLQSVLGEFYD